MKKTFTLIAASAAVLSLSACNALDMVDVGTPPVEAPFQAPQSGIWEAPQAPGPTPGPEVPFVAPQAPGPVAGPEVPYEAPQAPCNCGEQP